jgi:hypothetical protein
MQREARRRIERRAEVGQVRADAERESAEIVGRLYDATAASGPPWRGTGRRRQPARKVLQQEISSGYLVPEFTRS